MATLKNAPICLIIMDGWGIGNPKDPDNAIAVGKTPVLDGLVAKYPNSQLQASGEYVGLPDGQMGNSEVGRRCSQPQQAPLRASGACKASGPEGCICTCLP